MNWSWDNLRFFLSLARHTTLTHAASELGVSHTTVLRRIKAFEVELGTHLFEKTPSGYQLTSQGQQLLSEAENMESAMSSISRRIVGADQRLAGQVTITTTDTIGYALIPPVLHRLQLEHPQLELHLRINTSIDDMSRRIADIAVRTGNNPPDSLVGSRLGKVRFVACASRRYCERFGISSFPSDLRGHRFVLLDESFDKRPFQRWIRDQLPPDAPVTIVNGPYGASRLCRESLGIALVPNYLVLQDEELVLLEGDQPELMVDLWVLTHEDFRNTARIRVTRDRLAEALKPHLAASN
ncbi:MAG: LysR family transcriptional regulator [Pseudomonadota bacterium]